MSLVDDIAGKGFLPVRWLTLAQSSVTSGVRPRIYAKWPFFGKHRENRLQETLVNSFERASHPCSNYDPIAPLSNLHFSRAQAMYACIHETGARFFEGVCTPSNATAHSYDPPPPCNTKEPEPHWQGSGPKRITSRPTVSGDLTWGRGRPPP